MADLTRTVEIIFQGTDSMAGSIDSIGTKIDGLGTKIENVGNFFQPLVTAITGASLAMGGVGVAAAVMRSDFETETQKMAAALNLPKEEVGGLVSVVETAFTSGFYTTIESAFSAATTAAKSFKSATVTELGEIVNKAGAISSVFDVDFGSAIRAAKTVVSDFGVSSEVALNAIGNAMREVADPSELIDSIGEYGGLFAEAGSDVNDFFNTILDGYDDSINGTDKVADAFKEFAIKIQNPTNDVKKELEKIGIDVPALYENMESGKTTIFEAFQQIIGKIGEVENQNDQFAAGVALLGTPFEDLGTKAVLELGKIGTGTRDVTRDLENMVPEKTVSKSFSNLRNTMYLELVKNSVFDDLEARIVSAFDSMEPAFKEAVSKTDFSPLVTAIGDMLDTISEHFSSMDLDLTTAQGMGNALQLMADGATGIVNAATGFYEATAPIISFGKDAYEWFVDLNPETQQLIGYVAGLSSVLTILGGVVAVGGTLVLGLGAVVSMLSGPVGLVGLLGALSAAAYGITIGLFMTYKEKVFSSVKEWWDAVDSDIKAFMTGGLVGYTINAILGEGSKADIEKDLSGFFGDLDAYEIEVKENQNIEKSLKAFFDGLDAYEVEIKAITKEIDNYFNDLDSYEKNLKIVMEASPDETSFEKTEQRLERVGTRADGSPIYIEVPVSASGIDKTKADIDKKIPSEKMLEIKLQGDIDKEIALIESSAETAQAAFKYTAEVNIAEAKSAADVLKSAFESVGDSVVAMSDSVSDMFSSFVSGFNDLPTLQQWNMEDMLEDQQELQRLALESQIKLNDAQVDLMEAKAEAMRTGDGMIKIDTTGIEPALEMVMWEIIKKVQIRASEESADFLLGIS